MSQIPFLAWLLQGLPESIALVFLATTLIGVKAEWKKVLAFGVLHGIFAYSVRMLPVSLGVHTVILIILLSLWVFIIVKEKYLKCIFTALVTFLTLIIGETFVMTILVYIFKLNMEVILLNTYQRILYSWPQVILIFSCGLLLKMIRSKNAKS